ncbi:hypothetical protein A0U94_14235 (plasmid) [Gluconobacter albidus]|nr:hypothetical protein A0U94_14235 [Gluconobacter albidus]
MYAAERRMRSGGRKRHQFMVIADCPLRGVANGRLYVRHIGVSGPAAFALISDVGELPHASSKRTWLMSREE